MAHVRVTRCTGVYRRGWQPQYLQKKRRKIVLPKEVVIPAAILLRHPLLPFRANLQR